MIMTDEVKPVIGIEINDRIYNYKLFQSLDLLSKTFSQRKAAKELGISHSVFNRRIINAEKSLGYKLVDKVGSGSELTDKGLELLDIYHTYNNRLKKSDNIRIAGGHIITGLIESLDLPFNIQVLSTDNDNAYDLAKDDLIDILALDDPLLAFKEDLNFTPIAFDSLVLVSNDENNQKINAIDDLSNLDFVSVKGTAQRLVWDTLNFNDIDYNIVKEVKSQFDAFKLVKNSDILYTFLNASYFKGNSVLKNQTRHSLGLVYNPGYDGKVDDFVEYILNKCSDVIRLEGFTPIGY